MFLAVGELRPRVHASAFVAPTAVLIGDVVVEAGASIWFGAVLRGDMGRVTVGAGSNVQDLAVLHEETTVGRDCSIAHLALVHRCVLEDRVLVGNGALVFGGCHLGAGAVIGAGAQVTAGTTVPPGTLMLGAPARAARSATTDLPALLRQTTLDYARLRDEYRAGLRPLDAPDPL
jgi:carbonic anhydrase/acetyltransferase-like protein (isoleucine patch superfamily)